MKIENIKIVTHLSHCDHDNLWKYLLCCWKLNKSKENEFEESVCLKAL